MRVGVVIRNAVLISALPLGLSAPGDAVARPAPCGPENRSPVSECVAFFELEVDDACNWQTTSDSLAPNFSDPDGHDLTCWSSPAGGAGLGSMPINVWCEDECGAEGATWCEPIIVPRDRTPAHMTVDRPDASVELGGTDAFGWWPLADLCEMNWTDNCTPDWRVLHGITEISSSDPDELIGGEPGAFSSASMFAEWHWLGLDLDANRVGRRVYDITYTTLDAYGNFADARCRVGVDLRLGPMVIGLGSAMVTGISGGYSAKIGLGAIAPPSSRLEPRPGATYRVELGHLGAARARAN